MNVIHSRRQVFLNILLWKTCLKKKTKSYFLRTHCFIHNLYLFSPNTTVHLLKGGRMLIKNNTASAKCSTEFKIKCLQRLFAIMPAIKVYGSYMGSSNNLRYVTALSWWELKLACFSQTLTKEQKGFFLCFECFFATKSSQVGYCGLIIIHEVVIALLFISACLWVYSMMCAHMCLGIFI